jgi:uncharacterized membrane protein YhaH (DUF805 family)
MQNAGIIGLLFSYQGRINRGKYWLAAAIYFGLMILVMAVAFISFGNSLLAIGDEGADDSMITGLISKGIGFILLLLIIYIPMVISGVFVGIKRLHDRDKSGWWILVFYLLPSVLGGLGDTSFIFSLASFAVAIWGLVELGLLRGTVGPNQYGPDPLAT